MPSSFIGSFRKFRKFTKIVKRAICVFCVIVTLLLMVVTLTPAVPVIAGNLATDWYAGDADVLIVLGGSMLVSGTGPEATLGYDSYLRCVYAWWNIQRFKYSYIVVTGNEGLAEAMAAFFRQKGVAASSILVENGADNTFQNAQFVRNLLRDRVHMPANPRLALLTSDYHCRRAKLVFERAGLHVRVIPVPDLMKQPRSPAARLTGFFLLTQELAKYAIYAVNGKL